MAKTDKEILLDEIKGLITDNTKGLITEKDLDAKVEAINKKLEAINSKPDNHEEVKALKESVEKFTTEIANLSGELKALKENPQSRGPVKAKSLAEAIMQGFEEAKKNNPSMIREIESDGVKKLSMRDYFEKYGNKSTPEIKIDYPLVRKVAVDMTEAAIVGNYVDHLRLTELDPNRVGIPLTLYPHVTTWMPSRPMSSKNMAMLVVGTYVDGAGTKTQGSAPSQSSFLLTTVSFPAFVIGTYFKFSDETLEDLSEVAAEVAATGPDKLLDEVNDQILGTSGDESSAIAGLLTANKMTAFASTWNSTVPAASVVDVIEKMKLQGLGNKYPMDVVILNPTDLSGIGADKDQLDNSKTDRRVVYNQIGEPTFIAGLQVIRSTSITADTCVVLARNQVQIGDRRALALEFGYDSDDFKVGKKTARLSVRLAFGVRDKAAVIYCSGIAAAKADLKRV